MEARTSALIDIRVKGDDAVLLLSGTEPMTTNELANLLIELSHFDIRFKDMKVVAGTDTKYGVVLRIRIPEPSAHDYVSRLEFFLSRRLAMNCWYLRLDDQEHQDIIINM